MDNTPFVFGPELIWLSRLMLGAVLFVAGCLKLVYRTRFQDTLSAMELLPRGATRMVVWLLPPVEIVLGASVVAGCWLPLTGLFLWALLCGFLLALVAYRWHGGKELACGCFADFEQKTPTVNLIWRNSLLLVLGLPLLTPADHASEDRGLQGWLLAWAAVFGVLLAWALMSRLLETVKLLRAEINMHVEDSEQS